MISVKHPIALPFFRRFPAALLLFLWFAGFGCQAQEELPLETQPTTDSWVPDLPEFEDPYQGEPAGVVAAFELKSDDIFSFPFPTDLRRDSAGRIDWTGFPDPHGVSLLGQYIDFAEIHMRGFSGSGGIYVRFEGEVDTDLLPEVMESAEAWSTLWLIDADPESLAYGERWPVEWEYQKGSSAVYLPENLLMVRPVPGRPLREGGRYAFVVRRELRDVEGRVLGQPDLLRAFLAGQSHPDLDAEFIEVHMPLLSLAESGHLNPFEIAVATVFTVDRFTDEMRLARNVIHDRPAPRVSKFKFVDEKSHYNLYRGVYTAPNFQQGEKPYPFEDGGISSTRFGTPIVAQEEEIRFAVAVPLMDLPEGYESWPIVMYAHGTGGNYRSFTTGGKGSVANRLAKRGVATLGIDLPLHGTRYDSDEDLSLLVFNVLNPDSSRANFRQSGIDFFSVTRLVRESLEVPGEIRGDGEPVKFDPERVGYFGHSQGGLAGVLFAPFEPEVRVAVLSGAGGGLTQTVMLRKDPLDIHDLLAAILEVEPEELTALHPVLTVVQGLVDITDPINYAASMIDGRFRGGAPMHVLLTEGVQDALTPGITTECLAAAAGVPLLSPPVQVSDGLVLADVGVVQAPVSNNLETITGEEVTAALLQNGDHGHYLVFDDDDVADRVADFLASVFYGEAVIE